VSGDDESVAIAGEPSDDHLVGGKPHRGVEVLAEVDQVGLRRAVTHQHLGRELERGRKAPEPGALRLGGVLEGVLVALSARLGGAGEQLSLVVAADDRGVEPHQEVGGLRGLERPRQEVSGDHQPVDVAQRPDAGEHRLQRPDVAVDVGDDGEPHWPEPNAEATVRRAEGCPCSVGAQADSARGKRTWFSRWMCSIRSISSCPSAR
jgi:hypothetical protein